MALNRNRKMNPSSRYSRMEEPWLDDADQGYSRESAESPANEGFGVRDSYSRQADYGRPDGYRELRRQSRNLEDTRVYSAGRSYADRSSAGIPPKREVQYDAWDDPEYDDRYDEEPQERYEKRGETIRAERTRRAAHPGRTGFIVKLVLLLIASAALAAVWRFTRMDHQSLKDVLVNPGVQAHEGYRDFVIFGVDSREGSLTENAHSDTIILCSMNTKTGGIRLASVYRDTYLDNTNGEYRKATECYFFGGPGRAVNMLNKNLDLALADYITVDFNAVVRAVDLVGGVDVEVTEDELPYINGYQTENAQVTGAEITPVTSAGYQHLNGIQALAYCRIRYTAGSDYRRTERQRTVLAQIFQNAKQQGAVKTAQIMNAMFPYISTSFSNTELLGIASGLSDYSLTETCGFPFDLVAANISAGDCVVPVNLASNVSQLQTFLYAETGYTPSSTVQEISAQIAETTGIY